MSIRICSGTGAFAGDNSLGQLSNVTAVGGGSGRNQSGPLIMEGSAFAEALFEAMTTPPSPTRQALITNTINLLVINGLWNKLDLFYMLAAENEQAARLNWKTPGSFTLTATNSPSFVTDRGFAGNGTTSYLDTNWNPLTQGVAFTLNSASFGCWVRNTSASSVFELGAIAGAGLRLSTRTAGGTIQALINDLTGHQVVMASAIGLTVGSRPDASNIVIYKNGAIVSAPGEVDSVSVGTVAYFSRNVNTYSPRQIAFGFWGAGLSANENSELYKIINAYMLAVGAA